MEYLWWLIIARNFPIPTSSHHYEARAEVTVAKDEACLDLICTSFPLTTLLLSTDFLSWIEMRCFISAKIFYYLEKVLPSVKVCASRWFLSWLNRWRWSCWQLFFSQLMLTLKGLHGDVSQNIELFISTNARASNPTYYKILFPQSSCVSKFGK
jgi:hypothetical protein